MKKILFVLVLFVLASCAVKTNDSGRIKIIESKSSLNMTYEIVEIDGQEYLSTHGGIIKLEKSK